CESTDDNDETDPPKQCSDGLENDADGKTDQADPGCHTDGNAANSGAYDPSDDDETNPPQPARSDGHDNDTDTNVDQADPEADTPPACADGLDNDGDGKTDYDGGDPGCTAPGDDSEDNPPVCGDGVDNDADGRTDSQEPACHTDGDPTNTATYDATRDSEAD